MMRIKLNSSESSESIQSRSDANAHVEVSEYTLKSKFPEIKHLSRTLRGVIFQSSFNCCSIPERLLL